MSVSIAWTSVDWRYERETGRAFMGGVTYYREALPSNELNKLGYDSVLGVGFRQAKDGHIEVMDSQAVWHSPDIWVHQRYMQAGGDEIVQKARAAGVICVGELDDNFWSLPKSILAYRATDPKINRDNNRLHYKKMLMASDAIIVSTPSLARSASNFGVPTFVCRNAIDPNRWPQCDVVNGNVLGWVGGLPWRENDLGVVRDVVGPWCEETGFQFFHGGHVEHDADGTPLPTAISQIGIDPTRVNCSVMDMCDVTYYPGLFQPITIGIAPMVKSDFNLGKSWLKGLEYAACGLPFVASDLPEYRELGCGRLAKNTNEWWNHLDDLRNPIIRLNEGRKNRKRAEDLSISRMIWQWEQAFADIAGQKLAA